jgi:hypothetical protein
VVGGIRSSWNLPAEHRTQGADEIEHEILLPAAWAATRPEVGDRRARRTDSSAGPAARPRGAPAWGQPCCRTKRGDVA